MPALPFGNGVFFKRSQPQAFAGLKAWGRAQQDFKNHQSFMMDQLFIFCAHYLHLIAFLIAGRLFFRLPAQLQIRFVVFGLTCAILSFAIAVLAGLLYYNPRPFVMEHFKPLIDYDTGNGFPSDHVLLVSCLAAVVTRFHKTTAVLIWIMALMVAVARVYVGIHHSLDVITSMVISIVIALLVYEGFKSPLIIERCPVRLQKFLTFVSGE